MDRFLSYAAYYKSSTMLNPEKLLERESQFPSWKPEAGANSLGAKFRETGINHMIGLV